LRERKVEIDHSFENNALALIRK